MNFGLFTSLPSPAYRLPLLPMPGLRQGCTPAPATPGWLRGYAPDQTARSPMVLAKPIPPGALRARHAPRRRLCLTRRERRALPSSGTPRWPSTSPLAYKRQRQCRPLSRVHERAYSPLPPPSIPSPPHGAPLSSLPLYKSNLPSPSPHPTGALQPTSPPTSSEHCRW